MLPICRPGTTDFAMIEILFIYQQVRNPVQATARRSVVPQPVSRHTRQAAMPRKHQFVKRRLPADDAVEPAGVGEVGARASALGDSQMTNKPDSKNPKKNPATPHPGMMGDGTEEQNLGQPGNQAARIKKDEVDAAFAKDAKKT
jgi:hypothetical protein